MVPGLPFYMKTGNTMVLMRGTKAMRNIWGKYPSEMGKYLQQREFEVSWDFTKCIYESPC